MKATVEFEDAAAEYQEKVENKRNEFHEKGNDFSELKDWEVIDHEEMDKDEPSESDNERSIVRSAIFFEYHNFKHDFGKKSSKSKEQQL